jgi:hypothetical protein
MQLLYTYKIHGIQSEGAVATARRLREMSANNLLFPYSLINIPNQKEPLSAHWYQACDFEDLVFNVSPGPDRLAVCASCGNRISQDAITCPQCHRNREREVTNLQLSPNASAAVVVDPEPISPPSIWVIPAALFAIAAFIFFCCGGFRIFLPSQ